MKYYIKNLWCKIIYLFGVVGYSICLYLFDKEFFGQNSDVMSIPLEYKDYALVKFFVAAVVLIFVGYCFISRYERKLVAGLDDLREEVLNFVAMVVVVLCFFPVVLLIRNLVLQGILTVLVVLVFIMTVMEI